MTRSRNGARRALVWLPAAAALLFGVAFWPWSRPPRASGTVMPPAPAPSTIEAAPERRTAPDRSSLESTASPLEAQLDASVDRLQQALAKGVEEADERAEWMACQRRFGRSAHECQALRSDVLYGAIAREVIPVLARDALGVDALRRQMGVDAYVAHLQRALDGADELTRISTLSLLVHEGDFRHAPLPANIYRDLGARSDAEVEMILTNHAAAPRTDEAATGAIESLALDPLTSARTRQHVLRALGQPYSADALAGVVNEVLRRGEVDDLYARSVVAPALAGCGFACADTIAMLAARTDEPSRLAAVLAAGMMPEDMRASVRSRVAASIRGPMSPELASERAYWLAAE